MSVASDPMAALGTMSMATQASRLDAISAGEMSVNDARQAEIIAAHRLEAEAEVVAATIWTVWTQNPKAPEWAVGLTWDALTWDARSHPGGAAEGLRRLALDEAKASIANLDAFRATSGKR